jgi:hypothetical protein
MQEIKVSTVVAYIVSVFVGHFVVWGFLRFLRWHTLQDQDREGAMAMYTGFFERAVATTLVVIAPSSVGPFILAWVAAKIAANWQRLGKSVAARKGTQTALIANVISFSIAIVAGVCINPGALTVWAK